MSKISIAELASVLMEKHDLKRTEAELFIRQLVVVVNEALKKDKVAKLKGLGTFKVQSVSARKSVNVNTGEAIVIEGRDKISFTADAVMRDLVNAPFAQFETVVVNDGVDFSSVDDSSEATDMSNSAPIPQQQEQQLPANESNAILDDSNDSNSDSHIINHEESSLTHSVIDETIESIENGGKDTNIENKHDEDNIKSTSDDVDNTTSNIVEDNSQEQVLENNGTKINPSESGDVEMVLPEATSNNSEAIKNNSDEANQIAILLKQKNELELESDELQETIYNYQKKVKLLIWSLGAIALIVVSGIVYTGSILEKNNNRIEHLIAQNTNLLAKLSQANSSTTNIASTQEQDSLKSINDSIALITKQKSEIATQIDNQSKVETEKEEAKTSKSKQLTEKKLDKPNNSVRDKEKNTNSIPSQDAYNKDPRIRTGAYVITGISQTVTIREGQTLSSISKTYLGPGMECYIEAVNGGNRELKVGDKVKIPALKTKKSLTK